MKKNRILALVLCLMMCLSVVTGCNLITRNDKAYFEAVVATIVYEDGTKEEITKRELLLGYNSYGSNYEQNYAQSMSNKAARKEALKATLDSIIDQHLTVKAVRDYYAEKNDPAEPLFKDAEKTYLWKETYKAVYERLFELFKEVAGQSSSGSNSSTSTSTTDPFGYNSQVTLALDLKPKLDESGEIAKDENGDIIYQTGYVLKRNQSPNSIREDASRARYLDNGVELDEKTENGEVLDMESETGKPQKYMYDCFASLFEGSDKESKNWKSAFKKYISSIKESYSYLSFEDDEECFLFELNRVYEIVRDQYIVEKYGEIYNAQINIDPKISNVSIEQILSSFSSKARSDFDTYKDDRAGFDSKALTDIANMEYIYDREQKTNFFYVAYLKLELDSQGKGFVTATVPDPNDKNKTTTKKVYATDLEDQLEREFENKSQAEKVEAFKNYLQNYNVDTTWKDAQFNTVVGVNSQGEAVLPSDFADDDDVKEKIVELWKGGKANIGDITSFATANDGKYLFFFAGEVKNLFTIDENFDASARPEFITRLAETKLNIFKEKTYLDKFYEELNSDYIQIFKNMNIQYLRHQTQSITAIENNIKDLYL